MSYEQKRLTVRVFLPGPMEKVVDWEAVASAIGAIAIERKLKPMEFTTIMRDHTTPLRPSRIDTGVDVVLHNEDSDNDGSLHVEFAINECDVIFNTASVPKYQQTIAALGFQTEPTKLVEVQAEGEGATHGG